MLEMDVRGTKECSRDEQYRKDRYNYAKTDLKKLREHFHNIDWKCIKEANNVNRGYEKFLTIYEDGVQKCVPKMSQVIKKKNEWYNNRCIKAKEERDKAWRNVRRRQNNTTWEKYKTLRNKYVAIRKEEERRFEKDIQ